MKDSSEQRKIEQECRRLTSALASGNGAQGLSQTELAFYQTFCENTGSGHAAAGVVFGEASSIDQSAGNDSNNLIDDPDAGRPDDPADANPAAPDPAITRE